MNRRNFLQSCASVPLVGLVEKPPAVVANVHSVIDATCQHCAAVCVLWSDGYSQDFPVRARVTFDQFKRLHALVGKPATPDDVRRALGLRRPPRVNL